MKISLCSISFRDLPIEKVISKAAGFGYHGVEIVGGHLQDYLQRGNKLSSLRKLTQRYGLSIPVISPYFNFTGDKEEFEKSVKLACRFMEYAVQLDCKIIRTFVGNVGSDEATPEQWRRCIVALQEICRTGKEAGVFFALETHPHQLMDTTRTTLRLLKEVDAPNLKVLLDVWHLFNEAREDPLEALNLLFPHVVHVHVKNMRRAKNYRKIVHLEEGDMDYTPFLKSLKEKGYKGFISVEWFGENPWEAVRHEIRYLKDTLSTF